MESGVGRSNEIKSDDIAAVDSTPTIQQDEQTTTQVPDVPTADPPSLAERPETGIASHARMPPITCSNGKCSIEY